MRVDIYLFWVACLCRLAPRLDLHLKKEQNDILLSVIHALTDCERPPTPYHVRVSGTHRSWVTHHVPFYLTVRLVMLLKDDACINILFFIALQCCYMCGDEAITPLIIILKALARFAAHIQQVSECVSVCVK